MFKIAVDEHGHVRAITDGNTAYEADTSLPCYPGPPKSVTGRFSDSIEFKDENFYVLHENQYNQRHRPRKLAIVSSSFDEYCKSRGLAVIACLADKTSLTDTLLDKAFRNPLLFPVAAIGAALVPLVAIPSALLSKGKITYHQTDCERIFNNTREQLLKYAELDAAVAAIKEEEKKKYAERASRRWSKYFKIHDLQNIDEMTGSEFESAIALLYARKGYKVTKTPSSGDFGVDVVAEKEGYKEVIQTKRYTTNVGVKAIQEVAAGAYHYKADHAVVVTSAYFTAQAKELAESVGVELIDRKRLFAIWAAAHKNGGVPPFDLEKYEEIKSSIDRILGPK